MATAQEPRVWIFMVDSRNSEDLRDLDHLDAILWGANPNARMGDITLMYRTAPYSDFAYLFSAASDPRPTRAADRASMRYVIELGDKVRLSRPLALAEVQNDSRLKGWSFSRQQQGAMKRKRDIKQEGFWEALRSRLVAHDPSIAERLREIEGEQPGRKKKRASRRRLRVFISYASPDVRRVRALFQKLGDEQGLNLWFDKESLLPTVQWHREIVRAIQVCDTVVICLSSRSVNRKGFAQEEIEMAIKLFDERAEGTLSILPVKLDQCEVPKRLARWQYAELFRGNGYAKIIEGLKKQAANLSRMPEKVR
jgi:hypothetical protein